MMPTATRKLDLSHNQRALLTLLQQIRFGRIDHLRIRDGEPVLSDARWKRTIKIGGDNTPHPNVNSDDFALRREIVEFLQTLRELGDGELTDVEIRNGIPFKFDVCGSNAD